MHKYEKPIKPFEVAADTDVLNIAELLSPKDLQKIGAQVVDGFEEDEHSRIDWLRRNEKAMEIATQVWKTKTYPWQGASNVKFPAMSIAALNFHARAYPALVPSKNLVTCMVHGRDEDGTRRRAAERINMHMTWQLLQAMRGWESDMDRLLITLPITGSEFKKTYYDPAEGRPVSQWVAARDLTVNYWTTDINTAARVTQQIEMMPNRLEELKRSGVFLDVNLGQEIPREDKQKRLQERTQGVKQPKYDDDTPYPLLEQHCWLDLDNDGYREPYVVTVEAYTQKVLRIVARYNVDDIVGDERKVIRIRPIDYFTHFIFIPSPDGGFYGLGFGALLGPLNEAVNTIINQLVDAGTLSNLQSGFISKNLRIAGGEVRFRPGQWQWVNALGMDLRDAVFPLPVREPSKVLLALLELLIGAGQQLTSTTDIMVGENPGQNQKATTTMAVVENGLKVLTAVYKRVRLSLGQEFIKIFDINRRYLDEVEYFSVVNPSAEDLLFMDINRDDYEIPELQIYPSADPNAVSIVQRLARGEVLMSLAQAGLINSQEATKELLDAMDTPQKDRFLQMPPPQPDFETQVKIGELELKNRQHEFEKVIKAAELQLKAREQGIKNFDAETKRLKMAFEAAIEEEKPNAAQSSSKPKSSSK